jgi:CYTH domain-containing protein
MASTNKIVELELTYLAKELPDNLASLPAREMLDIYIPAKSEHPILRIRKQGKRYVITKKHPVVDGDASTQTEETIPLSKEEYEELRLLPGKRVAKTRYCMEQNNVNYEIDVFKEGLEGLVLVDVEFSTAKDKENFLMPNFCLADVTQETFIAGGMLCGKSYMDIQNKLNDFKYKKLQASR